MTAHSIIPPKVGDRRNGGIVSEVSASHIAIQYNTGPTCLDLLDASTRGLMCSGCVIGSLMAQAARNGGKEGTCPHSPYTLEQYLHDAPGRLLGPWEATQSKIETALEEGNAETANHYQTQLRQFLSRIARTHGGKNHDDLTIVRKGYEALREMLDEVSARSTGHVCH